MKRRGLPRAHALMQAGKILAIGLAALVFSAALHLKAGIPFATSLVIGVVLFLVLGSAQAALSRAAAYAELIEGFAASNQLGEGLDSQARVAAEFAELQKQMAVLTARMDALQQAWPVEFSSEDNASFAGPPRDSKVERLSVDVERLGAKLDALRSQMEFEGKESQGKLNAALRSVEALVTQIAGKMGAVRARESAPDIAHDLAREELQPAQQEASSTPAQDQEKAILETVRKAVESNAIDLYLQPIVSLPQRRVRYYEALTRLRDADGQQLQPQDFLAVAECARLMPAIDNVMLYRSVQVLKHLSERSSARGLFCNISLHSLLDPDFFGEFLGFMEKNRALCDNLVFEFSQATIKTAGTIESESLRSLADLGFRFCLDQVSDLGLDFQSLHDKGFRFIKIESGVFLHRMHEAEGRIHPADMRAQLERHGLDLIVEKVEDERALAEVLDYGVKLGQGYLFSEPRSVRPEVFGETEKSAAA